MSEPRDLTEAEWADYQQNGVPGRAPLHAVTDDEPEETGPGGKTLSQSVKDIRFSRRATRTATQEDAVELWTAPDDFGSLADELTAETPEPEYLVERLVTEGSNVLLHAQYKSGKSTVLLNLMRALVHGEPLFGEYAVKPLSGNVALWNAEVDRRMMVKWLRDMDFGSAQAERLRMLHLRGRPFPLTSEVGKDWAVNWLRANRVCVWVLDPFAALFTGNENDNSEVREWLNALDEIKERAEVSVAGLVAHTGHAGEGPQRARGASDLMGWADHIWAYERGKDPSSTRRYLSDWEGRGDNKVGRITVDFDPVQRRLFRVEGAGMAADDAESRARRVATVVREHAALTAPGAEKRLTAGDLKTALGGTKQKAKDTKTADIALAVERGWVVCEEGGPGKPKWYSAGKGSDSFKLEPIVQPKEDS